jgi:Flp pilus assembly protein TadB
VTPQHADILNALFEGIGSIIIWRNVVALRRDHVVSGVDWKVTAFYSLWGLSNMVYYGVLQQPWSLLACSGIALGNTTWVILYLRNRNDKQRQT